MTQNPMIKLLIAAEQVVLSPNPTSAEVEVALASVSGDTEAKDALQRMIDERHLNQRVKDPKMGSDQPILGPTTDQRSDVFRTLRSNSLSERQLAQSMPGFGPDHVSWCIHNTDQDGEQVVHEMRPEKLVKVMDKMTWKDMISNGPLEVLLACVRAGQDSLEKVISDVQIQHAVVARILAEKISNGQAVANAILPKAPPELVGLAYTQLAHVSTPDVPIVHNRLLMLVNESPESVQAQLPEEIFRRLWEQVIFPNRAFNFLPASAPLTPDDATAMIKDFDKTKDSSTLYVLATIKNLQPEAVKSILDRMDKMKVNFREPTAVALADNGLISHEDAQAHALLLGDPLKKTEAIQEGIRRLTPGLYRLYRVACSVFSVWPEEDNAEVLKLRAAAWHNDGELYATALAAVGQLDTPENREILKSAAAMMPMLKSDVEQIAANAPVRAMTASGFDVAEEISQNLSEARPAHLDGKHSKGSFFVDSPSGTWFLKPGSGGTGPIEGVKDDAAPPSAREAAFWAVAQSWGLADDFTRAEWVKVGDRQYAAIKFLPADHKSLIDEVEENPGPTSSALESYRQRGRLWQWSVIDFVLGNGDQHGHNMLINPKGQIYLIDHGSAFAGRHFNPAYDQESFTPYYLRYTVPKDVVFNTLKPSEKLHYMPDHPMGVQGRLKTWLESLDPRALASTISGFGIDPTPSIARLERVQQVGSDLSGFVNRIWAGVPQ
jgi:hypothetical protein